MGKAAPAGKKPIRAPAWVHEARRESFDFLGYTFGPQRHWKDGRGYLGASPSRQSVARLREKVNDVLTPRNTGPWPEVRTQLNRLLRGWRGYFSYGSLRRAYQAIDHRVAVCVRQFLCRRQQVPTGGTHALSDDVVFGPLGVLCLRRVPPAARPRAWRRILSESRMWQIRTSGSMSGDGKRGGFVAATAPILDSTRPPIRMADSSPETP